MATEGSILCRGTQGTIRGTLLHYTARSVTFEVYNPYSILQLSEVLNDFKITLGEKIIYAGRAVVSSLLNTGIMLVCDATLVDEWTHLNFAELIQEKGKISEEVNHFLEEWQKTNQIHPEFRQLTSEMRSFLSSINIWLKQVDITKIDASTTHRSRSEIIDEIVTPLQKPTESFLSRLEKIGEEIPPEEAYSHKIHIRNALHPLVMCSPFVDRTYTKPLGFAGDYGMISMILDYGYQGSSTFSTVIDRLMLQLNAAEAHRNRIKILTSILIQELEAQPRGAKNLRVLNVGCGPSREVCHLIQQRPDLANYCQMTLMDFSQDALDYAQEQCLKAKNQAKSQIQLNFVHKSIDDLLREATQSVKGENESPPEYDLIYCAGLFDYFIDSICSRLISLFYDWLHPGGLLSITNIHPKNPQKHLMEYVLEWNVIHRNEEMLASLSTLDAPKEVKAETTGVNIFLNIRKNSMN